VDFVQAGLSTETAALPGDSGTAAREASAQEPLAGKAGAGKRGTSPHEAERASVAEDFMAAVAFTEAAVATSHSSRA
jgi:hypothetical protein